MAKRTCSITTLTPTGVALGANNLTDATYPFVLQGGSTTQRNIIYEIMMGGQAGASAVNQMLLARDSTQVGSGSNTYGTGQADNALDGSMAALALPAKTGNSWATNKPQRGTSDVLLNLSFNSFGGIVRWVAAPGEEILLIGNTSTNGEISLSCGNTGTPGAMGAHVIYESA